VKSAWETLRESTLLAGRDGFTLTRLLSPPAAAVLGREALRCHASASVARLDQSPDEDARRGNPARHLESATGGPGLQRLYEATALRGVLRALTGLDWAPSGPVGSYSYYRRPGHHLDLHRDIEECDLAVITCVYEHGAPADGPSGALELWPGRSGDRLADIRREPERGRVEVRLRPGESILLLGGVVPHRVAPVGAGHVRVVAPLCFRALG
jgi:hypothetical protein